MAQTKTYEGIHIKNGQPSKVSDALVVEAALQININKEPYKVLLPGV